MSFTINSISAADTDQAAAALCELWPRYSPAEITSTIDELLRPNGYNLVGLWEDGSTSAVSVLSYRIQFSLWLGKSFYIVDIATLPQWRGKGHASKLLDWAEAEAVRLGCSAVHLDSGVGTDRSAAHRLYMQRHYQISCHHFLKRLA
ncbi:GNAT family N-acetyltransferase [Pseudomonas sp. RTC3]|uniref:GNAT family N-acetyltransferase n=2 Tax=Pseudomonas TaxID=286 RepID=UPI002AB3C206|nr:MULTISPECIES: GNAT family N-acetyltransferase [unclassified Pseudomonas]MEB0063828.1 GNAT family N-acetyltransferase [Pseudomonas sp. RTC3]MDY7564981.1 GNAT family N-acetyltransferase [Pseudomonas sp. 5C2]MEB0018266.1 GNAT family N-acetyltransferase [Pseudomonas sp. RTB3]MEB0025296.1 GNAT family N-acetyltransferase [Pseudomonas sp. MH9.2]MEB0147145.1 GNAT family N-acetyltransferase [Pseudomonas sp. CCC2.2]